MMFFRSISVNEDSFITIEDSFNFPLPTTDYLEEGILIFERASSSRPCLCYYLANVNLFLIMLSKFFSSVSFKLVMI